MHHKLKPGREAADQPDSVADRDPGDARIERREPVDVPGKEHCAEFSHGPMLAMVQMFPGYFCSDPLEQVQQTVVVGGIEAQISMKSSGSPSRASAVISSLPAHRRDLRADVIDGRKQSAASRAAALQTKAPPFFSHDHHA